MRSVSGQRTAEPYLSKWTGQRPAENLCANAGTLRLPSPTSSRQQWQRRRSAGHRCTTRGPAGPNQRIEVGTRVTDFRTDPEADGIAAGHTTVRPRPAWSGGTSTMRGRRTCNRAGCESGRECCDPCHKRRPLTLWAPDLSALRQALRCSADGLSNGRRLPV
jgi:hypothetical protein